MRKPDQPQSLPRVNSPRSFLSSTRALAHPSTRSNFWRLAIYQRLAEQAERYIQKGRGTQ